jgi:hypothetical protein
LINNRLYPEHFTGAVSELKAAQWFLNQNMQVYMPIVQQSCVDFVVDRNGLKTVQVKTGTVNESGKYAYLQARTQLTNRYKDFQPKDLYDLLVVVYKDDIWIIPSDVVDSTNISLWNEKWDKYKVKDTH